MREAGLTTCRHSQREKATAPKGNGEARYTRGTGHRQVAPLSIVSTARMNVGLRAIMAMIEPAVEQVPTYHEVLLGDARRGGPAGRVGSPHSDLSAVLDAPGVPPDPGPAGLDRRL